MTSSAEGGVPRTRVCRVGDVPPQGMKCFDTALGVKVLVVHTDAGFRAYQGLCPHQDVCLDEGMFDGAVITCHQHLWQWDAGTGDAVGLAEEPLQAYPVEEVGDEIFVLPSNHG